MDGGSGRWQGAFFFACVIAGLIALGWVAVRYQGWLPPLASQHGAQIDRLLVVTLLVTGLAFVGVHLLLGYFAWRYRYQVGRQAVYHAGSRPLEVGWTTIFALVLIALISWGGLTWRRLHRPPPADVFRAEVTGQQFQWSFRYPGADGVFGRTDPGLIDETNNPLGIDLDDPAARDDLFSAPGQGTLHLPLRRPCLISVRSKDVVHSFYVPSFRVKMDAVPGMTTQVWFVPTQAGEFDLLCAELCGLGHYRMSSKVVVQEEQALQQWLRQQLTAAQLIWWQGKPPAK